MFGIGSRPVYTVPDYLIKLRQELDTIREERSTISAISNATHETLKIAAEELAKIKGWPLEEFMEKIYKMRTLSFNRELNERIKDGRLVHDPRIPDSKTAWMIGPWYDRSIDRDL